MNKCISSVLSAIFVSATSFAGEITKDLPKFNKVSVSQHIDVVFTRGNKESIRLEYEGISPDEINYEVKGRTLEIYLNGAKLSDKRVEVHRDGYNHKQSYYKDATVTAYVTYVGITDFKMMGDETAVFKDDIVTDNFTMKLYGENKVEMASLNVGTFKGRFYGENELTVYGGNTSGQKFNLYGENKIETRNLSSVFVSARYFGENRLSVDASSRISVFGLGEGELNYSGDARVKKMSIGGLRVRRI